ncbi:hypothetical protein AAEX28_15850 [Lentisphaerota bacterium WC36G]|nr:hypothetical protein LJT99_02610 [Lentisphaerae bacterium WC36]
MKKKKIFIAIFIVILAIIAVKSWLGELNHNFFLTDEDFENQRQKIEKKIKQLKQAQQPQLQFTNQLKLMNKNRDYLWQSEKNGRAEIELGAILKNIAIGSGFEFETVGSVFKKISSAEGITNYTVNVRGITTAQQFALFTKEISQHRPKLFWSGLNISRRDGLKSSNQNMFEIRGALNVIEITDPEVLLSLKRFEKQNETKKVEKND